MNDIFFLLGSDNTVTAVAETIQDLINNLEVETGNIIEWMKDLCLLRLIIIQLVLGPIHTSYCCRAEPNRKN